MTIGSSLFLIAAGAILRYAITKETWNHINIHTIGLILMIVGVVGLILGLFLYLSRGRRDPALGDPDEDVVVRRRRETL
jgi:hypothetical protein